jgi:hypothetical protein
MKKLILQSILIISLMSSILVAHAATQGLQLDTQLKPQYAANIPASKGGSRADPINIVLQLIAGSLIYAAGPIAVLMIAIGGFRYVISRGDQNQMEGAKKTIMWAVIGLMIIIISYSIIISVISIIGETGTSGADQYSPKAGF